jgi:hypothetical protein
MSEDAQPPPARFHLRPHARVGWIAVWLTAAFAACYGGALTVIAARGVNDANPWLSIFGLSGFVLAIGAGIAAFVAIVRRGERGLLLVLPTLLGIIAAIFILGEVLVPH